VTDSFGQEREIWTIGHFLECQNVFIDQNIIYRIKGTGRMHYGQFDVVKRVGFRVDI
jgi:hypothetical protein